MRMKDEVSSKITEMQEEMYVNMGVLSPDLIELKQQLIAKNPALGPASKVEDFIDTYLKLYESDFSRSGELANLVNNYLGKTMTPPDILDLLTKKAADFQIGDTYDHLEEIKKRLSGTDYLENFVKTFGRGNPEHIRNLRELLLENGIELTHADLKQLVSDEVKKQEYSAFTRQFDKHTRRRSKYDAYIHVFVDLFGRGDMKTLGYFGQLLSDRSLFKVQFEEDVYNYYESVEKDSRLKKFQENLKASRKKEYRLLEESRITMEDIQAMDGFKFSNFLAALFYEMGYDVEAMRKVDSDTRDLITSKMGERVLVRARKQKGFSDEGLINSAIEANKKYKCDRVAAISSTNFTTSAQKSAEKGKISLWNKAKLEAAIKKYYNY